MQLGTCSLHPVHTAFKNGLQKLDFPYDSFFLDLSFFSSCQLLGEKIIKVLKKSRMLLLTKQRSMVQQDGSVWSKLGWGYLSNLKTFPNIFQVSYSNRKDSSVQNVMNELLNNWSDLILKLILPSCYLYHKIFKVFCDFSSMISQWFTCSGLRFFSSLEVWWQISLQGNNSNLIEDEHKSFERTAWSSIKLLLNTFWRIYHMITR